MRTLLLADDSLTVQRVIALTFADEPIRVVTCGTGPQAMERMAAQRPDIVLVCTTLPTLSGYEVARLMRGIPELNDVPVLLLSGAFETVDEARFAASGANGVIEKPVEPTDVIGRVKELLGLKPEPEPVADVVANTEASRHAEPQTPANDAAPNTVFEVNDDWFADAGNARGAPVAGQRAVGPDITEAMLDQIASGVADRLNASLFGEELRTAMTKTVRATVSEIVSEKSERLVRDEIERIKNKK